MATGQRLDPYAQFNFRVEIDGITVAGFSEIGGLSTEQDVIEYREGSDRPIMRKLPGIGKFTNIQCKRGFTQDRQLWDWRKTTIDGRTERRNGSIILRNEAGEDVLRWNFREGWICKWEGPSLNATTNEIAIESLEICHEGLELE